MAYLLSLPGTAISSAGLRHEVPKKCSRRSSGDQGKVDFKVIRCLSTKYCDVRASDFGNDAKFSRQFSAPLKESSSSKQNKDDEERQNYFVNTGYAIRSLREEFPQIFYKELNFDIYRDDIVFKDPLNTFVGIENYKSIFWALRFYGKIFFKALRIDIISVSQPIKKVIMVRWTVHGIPRIPWETHSRFDGTSEYKLDKNGKIIEHRVDNIALNSPPKFRVLSVEDLIQSLGCQTARPTYFEMLSSSIMKSMPLIRRFTWVRYYLAFQLALAMRSANKA